MELFGLFKYQVCYYVLIVLLKNPNTFIPHCSKPPVHDKRAEMAQALTLPSNIILRLLRGTLGLSVSSTSLCGIFSISVMFEGKFASAELEDLGGVYADGLCGLCSEETGCSASQRFFSALRVPGCRVTPSTTWNRSDLTDFTFRK